MPNEQEGKKRPELFGYVWGDVGEGAGRRWPYKIANSQPLFGLQKQYIHMIQSNTK